MLDLLRLLLAGGAGLVLGAVFFGGLWWTVGRGLSSPKAALWFLASLFVRMGTALAGFYFVGRDDWRRLFACLLGFVVARFVVIWLTRASQATSHAQVAEVRHAP
ncbi:MAG: ATP synthase subunit I [Gemmatimonadaceae bacterium]